MLEPVGYLRSKWLPVVLLLALFSINIAANGFVAWIEYREVNSLYMWKPWVWEISSGLVIFVMLPVLTQLLSIYPLRHAKILYNLLLYILVAPIFSAIHIGGMVALREAVYWFVGLNYQFDWGPQNLLYEFLKDVRVFLFLLFTIESYRFITLRLQGEALPVDEETNAATLESNQGYETHPSISHFLVKKLHKEFLIKPGSIEWIESSGNYQNLHIQGQVYPMRCTHASLLEKVGTNFFKISRGCAVNIFFVKELKSIRGELVLELLSGATLQVSKSYKDELPAVLFRKEL